MWLWIAQPPACRIGRSCLWWRVTLQSVIGLNPPHPQSPQGRGVDSSLTLFPLCLSRGVRIDRDIGGIPSSAGVRGWVMDPCLRRSTSPDAYAWRDHYNGDRLYALNGLNRILTAGQLGMGYDARGNLTSSGGAAYGVSVCRDFRVGQGALALEIPMGCGQSYGVCAGGDAGL